MSFVKLNKDGEIKWLADPAPWILADLVREGWKVEGRKETPEVGAVIAPLEGIASKETEGHQMRIPGGTSGYAAAGDVKPMPKAAAQKPKGKKKGKR